MVAVVCHLHPAFGEFLRLGSVRSGGFFLPLHVQNLRVGAQAENGFDGEIGVVRQVSGKVIGAELVFGIKPFFHKVIGPLLENRRVLFRERRLPSALAMAANRMSMLPDSSTGMVSILVGSRPLASG